MLVTHGKPFGPFSRFRIDLHRENNIFVAKAFDANASDENGKATVFLEVTRVQSEEALRDCRNAVDVSPQWKEAALLGDRWNR